MGKKQFFGWGILDTKKGTITMGAYGLLSVPTTKKDAIKRWKVHYYTKRRPSHIRAVRLYADVPDDY